MEESEIFLSQKEIGLIMKVFDRNRDAILDFAEFFSNIQN
jgi:hypothetical protein